MEVRASYSSKTNYVNGRDDILVFTSLDVQKSHVHVDRISNIGIRNPMYSRTKVGKYTGGECCRILLL